MIFNLGFDINKFAKEFSSVGVAESSSITTGDFNSETSSTMPCRSRELLLTACIPELGTKSISSAKFRGES